MIQRPAERQLLARRRCSFRFFQRKQVVRQVAKPVEKEHTCLNEECPICLDVLVQDAVVFLCQHALHMHCWEPNAKNLRACPLCRSDVRVSAEAVLVRVKMYGRETESSR